jgi:hypothetical protein
MGTNQKDKGREEDVHLSSDDGDGQKRVLERGEGALLPVVVERRAGPLQLVDERDQVLHGCGTRSGWVELGVGGCEIEGRRRRGEVSPAASGHQSEGDLALMRRSALR